MTFKNLKPSQLPEGTVIGKDGPHYYDMYIKNEEGVWDDMFSGCGCCTASEHISDKGCTAEEYWKLNLTTTKTSDEFFDDYKVIAVPPGFLGDDIMLHGEWDKEFERFADGVGAHVCNGFNCEAYISKGKKA